MWPKRWTRRWRPGIRLARAESEAEWTVFLTDLQRRGLSGQTLELVCVDGGAGLLAALPVCYPELPVQRCWAHKSRNVLDKVRKADREAVRRGLQRIYQADNLTQARRQARRWADRWEESYPRAVACLRNDLDELLAYFRFAAARRGSSMPCLSTKTKTTERLSLSR